jgi:3-oxoacyl-[acyl-carrier protein] reductase
MNAMGVVSPAGSAYPGEPRSGSISMYIKGKTAVVTGAASGIGRAVGAELAKRGAGRVALVDQSDAVNCIAQVINESHGDHVARPFVGDVTDPGFRKTVYDDITNGSGPAKICVPAAGITRDGLAAKIDKETGQAEVYPLDTFRQVTEVNLIAPIYWSLEMVARIAKDRKDRGLKRWQPGEDIQGTIILIGSVSSQGNRGQISYATAKAGLEGAAATIMSEAIYHGVRCGVIHPGYTDTPMVQALGKEFIEERVLPHTQLRRLIQPEEIADAICFMISNPVISREVWADAGWHPPA